MTGYAEQEPFGQRLVRGLASLFVAYLLLTLTGCGASSDSHPEYPEQDIRFIVGVSPGGGFDTFARTLAPYLEEELPGDAAVAVENLTGAGGLRAANTLQTEQPDGYTIGITNTLGLAAAQVSGAANFDLAKFTWIGRLTTEPEVVLVNQDSEFESMQDLQHADRELRGAVTSLGASTGIGALLICDAFGIQWTPVTHEGGSEATLSVIRGDTDFTVNSVYSYWPEIEAGQLRPIMGLTPGEDGIQELPEVPMASEFGHGELGTALGLARDVGAPPGLPEDVRSTLARAFIDAVNNPGFRSELEEAGFNPAPLNAQKTEEAVAELLRVYRGYEGLLTDALNE